MNEVVRAKREEIELGEFTLEVFQLPNGDYRLSQSQVAEIVEKNETLVRRFLGSKLPEALPHKGLTLGSFEVEGERTRIKEVPILLAIAFWTKEARVGNSIAVSLLGACAAESIEKRADEAFGVLRNAKEYDAKFKKNFEELKLIVSELEFLEKEAESSQVIGDEAYDVFETLLKNELKFPVHGWDENKIRDELANLASRTDRWKLKIEDELEFEFAGKREHSYPDLTSSVFSGVLTSSGLECQVVFIFECKNPIVNITDIKECIYERAYLEAARKKYKTEHVFLFMVAPYGGAPLCYHYINRKLSPDDAGYVRVLTVKQLASFLKSQVIVSNPSKKGEITKRFRELLGYQILFAVEGFQTEKSLKSNKKKK